MTTSFFNHYRIKAFCMALLWKLPHDVRGCRHAAVMYYICVDW